MNCNKEARSAQVVASEAHTQGSCSSSCICILIQLLPYVLWPSLCCKSAVTGKAMWKELIFFAAKRVAHFGVSAKAREMGQIFAVLGGARLSSLQRHKPELSGIPPPSSLLHHAQGLLSMTDFLSVWYCLCWAARPLSLSFWSMLLRILRSQISSALTVSIDTSDERHLQRSLSPTASPFPPASRGRLCIMWLCWHA